LGQPIERTFAVPFEETGVITPGTVLDPWQIYVQVTNSLTSLHSGASEADMAVILSSK